MVACEVLVTTPAIRNLIREGKVHQIYSAMQAGGRFGMQTMDMSIAAHVKAGRISQADGVRAVPRPRGAPTPRRRRGSAPTGMDGGGAMAMGGMMSGGDYV